MAQTKKKVVKKTTKAKAVARPKAQPKVATKSKKVSPKIAKAAKETAAKVSKSPVGGLLPTLEELLAAGVHFGHTTKRWHPAMTPFIYKKKGNIHIIDIRQTVIKLDEALSFLSQLMQAGKNDILIIGTKKQISAQIKEFAIKHNLYYIVDKWLGGLFTNFKVVQRSLQTLTQLEEEQIKLRYILTKQELATRDRRISTLKQRLEGVMFMNKLPSAVIVIDGKEERIGVKEARLVKVPIVGVIDTNTDPRFINYPVPANDDSVKSVTLFLNTFSKVLSKGTNERLGKERKEYASKLDALSARIDQEYQARQALEQKQDLLNEVIAEPTNEADFGRIIKVAATRLEVLKLPPSLQEKLETGGIRSVEILSNKTTDEVRSIEGIGPKSAERIMATLQKYLKSKK